MRQPNQFTAVKSAATSHLAKAVKPAAASHLAEAVKLVAASHLVEKGIHFKWPI
jgi:hypothetical protein